MTAVLSGAWVAMGLIAKLAICHQIGQNYQRKTCEGMSGPFFLAGLFSYSLGVAYGVAGGLPALIFGQSPGVILALIVACQFIYYRKRNH